jgi:hypothetical protein
MGQMSDRSTAQGRSHPSPQDNDRPSTEMRAIALLLWDSPIASLIWRAQAFLQDDDRPVQK